MERFKIEITWSDALVVLGKLLVGLSNHKPRRKLFLIVEKRDTQFRIRFDEEFGDELVRIDIPEQQR